ncbi:hypothetical protein Dda_5575 [Drechslerella dactyloides]|uniref:Uncharacterized protein n=1 Tax=Drechslerella dactyloides TaxID=74499 RepID=A0AAD6NHN9_DREDA|nr:hypothetical protein Dda_5575 [Drechslerella dactyloides]
MKSLSDLPYDVLLNICHKLDAIRAKARQPPLGAPPAVDLPCQCSRCLRESSVRVELPPAARHDSPRRAYKYAVEQWNRRAIFGAEAVSRSGRNAVKLTDIKHSGPFRCESIFDGLSRTDKLLREMCVPFLFRNVVLATDDCLTLDRLEFYNQAEWLLQHVRCMRFFVKNTAWPNALSGATPAKSLPLAVANAVQLLISMPNLQTLYMSIEPYSVRDLLKRTLLPLPSPTPPEFFPKVQELYVRVGCEFIIPLCGAEAGLQVIEYDVPRGCPEKVKFKTWGMRPEEPFGGMDDRHAVAMLTGLQKLPNNQIWKASIGGSIDESGLRCMIPFINTVRELLLSDSIGPFLSPVCARLFRRLPRLRKLRFGDDADPNSASNPLCYMPRGDLLAVLGNTPRVTQVWYTDRFVCCVPRKVVDGVVQIYVPKVFWWDTWAPDGIGSPEPTVKSSGDHGSRSSLSKSNTESAASNAAPPSISKEATMIYGETTLVN